MNTQTQVHRLEAGQALALARRGAGPAVLTQGELVMQEPARWLAGIVVLPAPVRLVAPAVLPSGPSCSFVAAGRSCVVVEEGPLLFTRKLRAAATWLRSRRASALLS